MSHGNRDLPQVLVSFDGGSGANSAGPILAALDRAGVRTTFFLTGSFIRAHPMRVRDLVARGHEIGNHTLDHPHLTRWNEQRRHRTREGVDRAFLHRQLRGAAAALREVAGIEMAPVWRAPYGEFNAELLGWAAELGYRHVGWTPELDSLDWVDDPASPRYRSAGDFRSLLAARAARPGGLNGAILLMHLHSDRPEPERFSTHLGSLLALLHRSGYRAVPAGTLLRNLEGRSDDRPAGDPAR